jgi:hypothetical protein
MWAFAFLIDLMQSSLFFDLCSQFLILHFLISPYTQSHHLDLGLPFGRLPWGWLAKTWHTILLLSILLTRQNLFILINETIYKSPYNCISSLSCHLLQQLLFFIDPSIFLKTLRSKTANRLPVSELMVHASAPYVINFIEMCPNYHRFTYLFWISSCKSSNLTKILRGKLAFYGGF